jgi:hypothetical protein
LVNLRAGQRLGALPRWRWLFRRLILAAAAVHGGGGDMEPPRAVRGVKAGVPIFRFSVRTHSPTDWPIWKYSGDDRGVTPVSNHRPSEQAVIRTFNPALPRIRKIGYGRDRPPLSIPFNDFIHAIHPPVHLIRVIRPVITRRSSLRIDGPDDRAHPISCKVALFEFSARSLGKFLCENPCSLGKSARSRVNEGHPLPQATANVYHVPASAINPNDAAGVRPEAHE